jgi:site-specific DNA recombinase
MTSQNTQTNNIFRRSKTPEPSAFRALSVIRLSVDGENQTGDDTQRKRNAQTAEYKGMTIVGEAVDLGVSAKISPFLRPDLGDWLNNRAHEFEVIIVYKIDRLVRSLRDMVDIFEWCEQHGKILISTEEGIDFSTPLGKMFGQMLAMFAEMELKAITERVLRSREELREQGRWGGGVVPFGRTLTPNPEGEGYKLEFDPEYGPTLLEAIRRFIKHPSRTALADWLNERGVPTAMGVMHQRKRKRLEDEGRTEELEKLGEKTWFWQSTAVTKMLSSRTLLGYGETNDGDLVLDRNGEPVMFGTPILNDHEWSLLQAALKRSTTNASAGEPTPLVGVLYCNVCGNRLNFNKQKPYSYSRYHCVKRQSKNKPPCPGQNFHAARLYEHIGNVIVQRIGSYRVMRRKVVSSYSVIDRQLMVVDEEMDKLNTSFRRNQISAVEFGERIAALGNEREKITNQPTEPDSVVWESTGRTYEEWWNESTVDQRRDFLRDHEVKIFAQRAESRNPVLLVDFGLLLENLKDQGATGFEGFPQGVQPLEGVLPEGWTVTGTS